MVPSLALLALMVAVPPVQAPDCAWSAFGGGETETLRELRGRVVYVDFWTSWCRPCSEILPFLDGLDRDLHDRGLRIVGVNLDEDTRDAARFLERHRVGFTIANGADGACAEAFGVTAMPTGFLVDRSGTVRWKKVGFEAGSAAEIRARVEELLADGDRAP
jgi:thiol-disulfide isomerase/thioredoxin